MWIPISKKLQKFSPLFPTRNRYGWAGIRSKKAFQVYIPIVYEKSVFYILLDILFDEPPYLEMVQKEIKNDLLKVKDSPIFVTVPSIECILGDKMTAFAPHTTGGLYGTGKSMEIMKQMFDIDTLIGKMIKLDIVKQTYEQVIS